jgi:hypothetical protein
VPLDSLPSNLTLLAAVTLACLAPSVAEACDCNPPSSPEVARDKADAVFEGRVASVSRGITGSSLSVTLEVLRVWKGSVYSEVVVETPSAPEECGLTFSEGETWVMFATVSGRKLEADHCSGSVITTSQLVSNLGGSSPPNPGREPRGQAAKFIKIALGLMVLLMIVSYGSRKKQPVEPTRIVAHAPPEPPAEPAAEPEPEAPASTPEAEPADDTGAPNATPPDHPPEPS